MLRAITHTVARHARSRATAQCNIGFASNIWQNTPPAKTAEIKSEAFACRHLLLAGKVRSSSTFAQTVVKHPPASPPAVETGKFAVIAFAGKQFKVVEDDLLVTDRQNDVDIGEEIVIDDVLLVGSPSVTVVGRPQVEAASVRAVCEQHPTDKKVIIFKKKRRKGYRRKNGFRRKLSVFRILEIKDGLS